MVLDARRRFRRHGDPPGLVRLARRKPSGRNDESPCLIHNRLPSFAQSPWARQPLGEMADELRMASTRAVPGAILDSNDQYLYADLEGAVRHWLGKDQAVHAPRVAMLTEADADGQ